MTDKERMEKGWRWWRVWLFLRIVWRDCEGRPLPWRLAWEVAGIIHHRPYADAAGLSVVAALEAEKERGK